MEGYTEPRVSDYLNFRRQRANIVPECYVEGLRVEHLSTDAERKKKKKLGNTVHEPTFYILWVLPVSLRLRRPPALRVCHINRLSFNYFISF